MGEVALREATSEVLKIFERHSEQGAYLIVKPLAFCSLVGAYLGEESACREVALGTCLGEA